MSAAAAPIRPVTGATKEKRGFNANGWAMLVVELLLFLAAGATFLTGFVVPGLILVSLVLGVVALVFLRGFFILQPNEAEVITFFGRYTGTVRDDGFFWTNPLTTRRKLSLRVNNFNTEKSKVNDLDGNPIEIAAVVVWRVVDTAKATFDVENYRDFVRIQSETAVRTLAARYPYDAPDEDSRTSLRGSSDEVSEDLERELAQRLEVGGVQVLDARLTDLSYAPEIAGAMLQRQQAAAILAAREKIVRGAVGMVEMALASLEESRMVELTESDKADLVGSLMVVLTSDRGAQPVLTTR